MKPVLKIDWATHKSAKFAVENWHYSESMPAGKLVKVGAWENEKFIGVVLFGRGANNNIGKPYGLQQTAACELVRIALTNHITPVSKIAAIAMRFLKVNSPGLRLIISYADPLQGHHGGIYQAGNWIYCGTSKAQQEVMHNGKIMHKRTANSLFGTIKGMKKSPIMWKHKYIMPLDNEMKKQIMPLSKPYPKRASSETSDTSAFHAGKGGATPTDALQ
ncbi:MAG: protein Mom [Caulobacteraceae bacterium]|nr:protein Mom [Caulobacteraceae bacterium]